MPFLENIGGGELLIIGIVLVFLFGNKKMNEMAKGLGEGTKELKKAKKEWETTINDTSLKIDQVAKEVKDNIKESLDTEEKAEKLADTTQNT